MPKLRKLSTRRLGGPDVPGMPEKGCNMISIKIALNEYIYGFDYGDGSIDYYKARNAAEARKLYIEDCLRNKDY